MSEDKVKKSGDDLNEETNAYVKWVRSTIKSNIILDDPNPYRDFPQSIKSHPEIRRSKSILSSYHEIKDNYTIDECLNCYNELVKKELSEPICIGGAVGLHLQGIIKRDSFHDLDLAFNKIPELDDDIEDYKGSRGSYYKVKDKKDLPKSVIFEGILIDMFTDTAIQKVSVKYRDKEYICQDYRQILAAKLRMCLQSFKDYDDVIGKHISINIS